MWYFFGFLVAVTMMGAALYFQHVLYLEPCPLCIFQRLAVIAIGFICLVAMLHNPSGWGKRFYALIISATSLIGLGVALRHSYLQRFPPSEYAECGPGLEVWLETLPLTKTLEKVLQGTGDCSNVVMRFLGLSIPEWTALAFLAFALFGLIALFSRARRQRRFM